MSATTRALVIVLSLTALGGCAAKRPHVRVVTAIRPLPDDSEPVLVGAPATPDGWWKQFPKTRIPAEATPRPVVNPAPVLAEPEPVRAPQKATKKLSTKKKAARRTAKQTKGSKAAAVQPPPPPSLPDHERAPNRIRIGIELAVLAIGLAGVLYAIGRWRRRDGEF